MQVLDSSIAEFTEQSVILRVGVQHADKHYVASVAVSKSDPSYKVAVGAVSWRGSHGDCAAVADFLETDSEAVRLLIDTAEGTNIGDGYRSSHE